MKKRVKQLDRRKRAMRRAGALRRRIKWRAGGEWVVMVMVVRVSVCVGG